MNAAEFARRRARIERECHGRGKKYQRRIAHLVNDARAALVVMAHKIVGYRLPNGEMVCIKTRYRNWDEATEDVMRIQAANDPGARVPIRAYACVHCHGFHTTSQRRLPQEID
jgi:hypothetical protein